MSASKQGKQRGDSTNNISYFKQYSKVSKYHGMSQDTWFNYLHIIYIILQVLTPTHKSINKYLYFNLFKIWMDSRQQMSTVLFLTRVVSLHHIFSRQLLFLLLFQRCLLKAVCSGQRFVPSDGFGRDLLRDHSISVNLRHHPEYFIDLL